MDRLQPTWTSRLSYCRLPKQATATADNNDCAEVEDDVKTATLDGKHDPPTHAASSDDGYSAICLDSAVGTDHVDADMCTATADNDNKAAANTDSNIHKKRTRRGIRRGKRISNMIAATPTIASADDIYVGIARPVSGKLLPSTTPREVQFHKQFNGRDECNKTCLSPSATPRPKIEHVMRAACALR